MPDRVVRFTDSFFDRLDSLFAAHRGADGSPSATGILLYDIPRVRDPLADDFEGNTLATDEPGIRVYIGSGVLIPAVAVYAVCDDDTDDDTVEVIWIDVQSAQGGRPAASPVSKGADPNCDTPARTISA